MIFQDHKYLRIGVNISPTPIILQNQRRWELSALGQESAIRLQVKGHLRGPWAL